MHGWTGKILNVDLTSGRIWRSNIPEHFLHEYLGGRGLGVRLMRGAYRLDTFDPDMPLIFAVGPLCGTQAPTAARLAVVSRSPLTGTIYDCSAGGRFAWRLKGAGIDALRIIGRSATPTVLSITGETAELLPAGDLWGKRVKETVSLLSGRGSVAAIGPAGENGVLFANIMMGEGNSVGRGGLGAVMGAKGLKAIAVDADARTPLADPARFEHARADVMRLFRASPVIFGELGIAEFGTPALVDLMRQRRMAPTENFRKTVFAASDNYSGPAIKRDFQAKKDGCYGCPIQCKKKHPTRRASSRIRDGLAFRRTERHCRSGGHCPVEHALQRAGDGYDLGCRYPGRMGRGDWAFPRSRGAVPPAGSDRLSPGRR
ncbi:tungsten-containing aldehyde ferredoxin oxidoreductase [Geobacter sp. OR-1]|nr:tungsten-containing aldehyde ferredoxin oxidoreductase [Geobacter sp. OR-1]